MLFHAVAAEVGDVVVVKAVGETEKSEVLSRDASPRPSRPADVPVLRVKLELKAAGDVGNVVTELDATVPL